MESATVAKLIDNNTRQWNNDVIDGVFAEEEAVLIKQIPLSRIASEDALTWPHSQDGRYNCKSGYRFLKEELKRHLLNCPKMRIQHYGEDYGLSGRLTK